MLICGCQADPFCRWIYSEQDSRQTRSACCLVQSKSNDRDGVVKRGCLVRRYTKFVL